MNHSVVCAGMLVLGAFAMAGELVPADQEPAGGRSVACLRGAVYAESKEEPIGVWQTFTRAMLNTFSSKDVVQRRMIGDFREQLLDVRAAKGELLRRLQQFVANSTTDTWRTVVSIARIVRDRIERANLAIRATFSGTKFGASSAYDQLRLTLATKAAMMSCDFGPEQPTGPEQLGMVAQLIEQLQSQQKALAQLGAEITKSLAGGE